MPTSNDLFIPMPSLFSFDECIWFLNRNYDDCLHRVSDGCIVKTVAPGGELMLVRLTQEGAKIRAEILHGKNNASQKKLLEAYIRQWFDMSQDLAPFYALLKKDKTLAYMVKEFNGLRLVAIADLFEALCWSIIGQQINLTFAYKLKRRLVEAYGQHVEFEGERHYAFPSCEVLAEAQIDHLRSMQFSHRKAEYVIGVAKAFAAGEMSIDLLRSLPDMESRQKALTAMKGIGIWTANYVLMKTLKDGNSIPYGDVGLLNALSKHGIISERSDTEKIDAFFKKYKGWESYVVFYLWRSLAAKV